jgi:hypothetical protein
MRHEVRHGRYRVGGYPLAPCFDKTFDFTACRDTFDA